MLFWERLILPETFVDNDIVLKLLRIGYLDDLATCLGHGDAEMAVLETLRFKIGGMLAGEPDALTVFIEFIARVAEPQPTDAEVLLAARMEEAALLAGHAVDGGESVLFAMAASRGARVATGDKRAVIGLASLAEIEMACKALAGTVLTLEWLTCALLEWHGVDAVRDAVCAANEIDRTLGICFACHREECPVDDIRAALSSYQRDLSNRTNGFVSPALPAPT